MKYISGIGSRETPEDIQQQLTELTAFAYECGLFLRSGAAHGADRACERGVPEGAHKQIFLPWRYYNDHPSELFDQSQADEELAALYHPAWKILSQGAKKLQARNVAIILGPSEQRQPSELVICWTPDGCTSIKTRTKQSGGTGQGIAIADAHGIPVYNLHHMLAFDEAYAHIESLRQCHYHSE